MIPSTTKIIIIGGGIVFGPAIVIGLIVGHFFGFWLGLAAGGILLLSVISLTYRKLNKMAREQENKDK